MKVGNRTLKLENFIIYILENSFLLYFSLLMKFIKIIIESRMLFFVVIALIVR